MNSIYKWNIIITVSNLLDTFFIEQLNCKIVDELFTEIKQRLLITKIFFSLHTHDNQNEMIYNFNLIKCTIKQTMLIWQCNTRLQFVMIL